MKHASAVGYLMQQRGPDAFREDWDKSMLIAFRGILVSQRWSFRFAPNLRTTGQRGSTQTTDNGCPLQRL